MILLLNDRRTALIKNNEIILDASGMTMADSSPLRKLCYKNILTDMGNDKFCISSHGAKTILKYQDKIDEEMVCILRKKSKNIS